jgi:3-oxoacyl-[acyl-carrier-protein] synthase III
MKRSVITGSGNFIPSIIKTNNDFLQQQFFNEDGTPIPTKADVIIDKFKKITGIEERRYLPAELNTSDMAAAAAKLAITDSNIDPESLDLIIVAHNFGDVSNGSNQSDAVPSLANRVKNLLSIKNPTCIAFDVLFGCPGWLMALIQADAFFKAGIANKALIIGAETLSRVIDKYDRDSMIFSDGAGAIVLEYKDVNNEGVLSAGVLSHSGEELDYLYMDDPYHNETNTEIKFMKMKGRKVYEYALKHVPEAMKECLDKSGESITDLKKIFIHQANEKMDEAIVQAFYKLYNVEAPKDIMPMCIHFLGNSSVATIPTLYDLVKKGCDAGHNIYPGDLVLFASVGAGMNINAVCYRCI